ncbi:aspartyl protease family protein At5g10770-like isoform X1 [Phragmites australis]|uniref:aspartyl protease family protein At5g10770-like isoform X1 n=1 Tax=Phragmites australis TaxID=29695 RepID=UPI002D7988FB|nr:aspartyl protease family protein At5g10770-like isoform X1 [Phragmites australis]
MVVYLYIAGVCSTMKASVQRSSTTHKSLAMVSAVPLLLLLLLCSSTSLVAHAGADELNYIVVETSSLKPHAVCKGLRVFGMHAVHPSSANHTGSWMPLSSLHGPCSPSWEEGVDDSAPSMVDTLRWDQHRAHYIQRKLSGNVSQEDLELAPSVSTVTNEAGGGAVSASVGDGSGAMAKDSQLSIDPAATGGRLPGVKQTMLLDTASDVAWVQCAPCPASQCYPQTDVLYDPSKSGSSAPFPCSSPTCRQLGPYANGCTSNSQCQYRVQYPDGSTTSGTFISDLLTLSPNGQVPKFQFGCSHAARGSFSSSKTAGIMALGRGAQSLTSQTMTQYGQVFSYCFPPTTSHQGFFILGLPTRSASRYAVTPILKTAMLYQVRLQAITVAGQRLNVPPTVFAAGAVLDSRTVITRLPPTAYQALRSAFRDKMRMYRAAAPNGQLDTCYDFTGVRHITLPTISLVFDRTAGVELDQSGILYNNCLAFTSNGDDRATGIIGYVQLQTIEVLYNVAGGSVGFRRGAC